MFKLQAALAPLALAACFVDPGRAGPGDTPDTSSTATDATGATDTTDADPTTGGPTTASADPTSSSTTATSLPSDTTTTTTPTTTTTADSMGPVCGDGVIEGDETCDDGNNLDDDLCRNDCTAAPVNPASCNDGIQNQDETAVDCGGATCPACDFAPCHPCVLNSDCMAGLVCDSGVCNEIHVVNFSWVDHCGTDGANYKPVPTVYGGIWRVSALGGGGLLSANPAWGWSASCVGFTLSGLGVPFIYDSAEEAFAAVNPKSVTSEFLGGPTACGVFDDECADNVGVSDLELRHACE